MDLPSERETNLHFLEAVRKAIPSMDRFRRYDGELALESSRRNEEYRWLSLQRTNIRTGHVNPQAMSDAYDFHRLILKIMPYHLSISPLDVDYLELMFGFDLECKSDHDEVVFEALFADGPLANLFRVSDASVLDVQPVLGMSLSQRGDLQAYYEVKTRTKSRRGSSARYKHEPISLFLTLRRYGPVEELDDLGAIFTTLADRAETMATERFVPDLLTPIARQITSSSA
ncbi:MAG: hypothetical protein CMJ18_15040 [Phycisphaeraceae bacterium]|nr:hypothetical protein [Phycisphaeraceae bacterium]